ncbi:hypothetical protein FRC02_006734 [Tulasnella sp. 418]|nr:hypothetical protein FRC02_006734 [Tulasnella sp. 418]
MTQLASSIPRLEFSESASESPEDETTLFSPFIWLPAASKLSKAKAKTTKYASDGIDGLWMEAKKEYINQMPRRQASMLAEYDLTGKINGVNRLPGGNVTELYKGTMREDSMKNQLAVKVFSPMRDLLTRQKAGVQFFMWFLIWHALRHPNVVPFLGFTLSNHLPFALVFPWYDFGNVIDYLKHNPAVSVHRRIRLIQDVVAGMTYLHSVATVHGDLRGETVLVADDGTARIANSATLHFMKKIASDIQINEHKRKECRFLAPELLNEYKPTFESDIWAFGCLASQILSDRAPYDNHDDPASVNSAINNGELPIRDIHERGQDNQPMVDLWQIITSCWAQDPESRPTAQNIQSLMQGLASSGAAIDANGHNKDPLSDKIGDERSYLQGNGDN